MSVGINTNYSNYYNGITQTQQTQKTDKADNSEKPQTLEDFKKEMYDTINKMQVHSSQSKTQVSVNISDKAFEKMMKDPEYKNLMLQTIQRDLNGAYPTAAAPSYSVITIGNDCEYRADAYGSAYGDTFAKASSNSFLQKNTKKSSSDYDDFNRRKKQSQIDYQDMAAKNLAEKRLQEKWLLDKEYDEKMQEQKQVQSAQLQKAIAGYENNMITETT